MTMFTDDYGMCCNEKMARECAKEYYQREREERFRVKRFIQGCLAGGLIVLSLLFIIVMSFGR